MPVIINGTTGISGTDGSAATPAIQGTDTNTGMYFPAADTIAFSEGGVEALRLNSDGGAVFSGNATFNAGLIPSSSFLRNRIINGDMRIDQRNAGASVNLISSGIYGVDRWFGVEDSDGTMTMQRSTNAPAGFTNSLAFTTGTADPSLAATQYVLAEQMIEGVNTYDLGWGTASARTVTLSFWVRSSLTGTFGGSLRNIDYTRGYPFTYSISVANTWEFKSVTIPGDTSGTWSTDTSVGIRVDFGLGVGSTFSGTAAAWANGNFVSATGAVSVIGTASATWFVTGVQLEVGSAATPFERRLYAQELFLCQRYYQVLLEQLVYEGTVNGGSLPINNIAFPVPMRVMPSTSLTALGGSNASTLLVNTVNATTLRVQCTALATGSAFFVYDARMSAEF